MQRDKKVTIRPIDKGDYEVILRWHKEHLKINFPSQKLNKDLFCKDFRLVFGNAFMIVNGTERVGVISFDTVKNEYENKTEGRIRYLHIDKKYRGKGYATFLMKFAEKEMKKAKFITLGTHVENHEALMLYNGLGYKPYRIIFRKDL